MTYRINKDLPSNVTDHLPLHAQTIYREAFNHAYENPKKPHGEDEESVEEAADKAGWAAVKKEYKKKGDEWIKKEE